jgi:hypothetical protein
MSELRFIVFRQKKVLKSWMRFIKVKLPKLEIDPSKLASRVCSDHFTASDFERDLKNEMLGLPVKKLLKHDAVPQKLQTQAHV